MFILKKQYRYFVKKGMFSDAIHGWRSRFGGNMRGLQRVTTDGAPGLIRTLEMGGTVAHEDAPGRHK